MNNSEDNNYGDENDINYDSSSTLDSEREELKEYLKNGLSQEEKDHISSIVKSISKKESEDEILLIYNNCSKILQDHSDSVDFDIYISALEVMLSGEYVISLIEEFNDEIKNKYLTLTNKLRKAIEFDEKYNIKIDSTHYLKYDKDLNDFDALFSSLDSNPYIDESKNDSSKITGTIQNVESLEALNKKIEEIINDIEKEKNTLLEEKSTVPVSNEPLNYYYDLYCNQINELDGIISKLNHKKNDLEIKKADVLELELLFIESKALFKRHKAMLKYTDGLDISEELFEIENLKKYFKEISEQYMSY